VGAGKHIPLYTVAPRTLGANEERHRDRERQREIEGKRERQKETQRRRATATTHAPYFVDAKKNPQNAVAVCGDERLAAQVRLMCQKRRLCILRDLSKRSISILKEKYIYPKRRIKRRI